MGEVGGFGTGMVAAGAEWANHMWHSLNIEGVWGVPRCGLVYRKESSNTLALIERMPWQEGMPWSREELLEYQDSDHRGIVVLFAVIGVTVTDETHSRKVEGPG